MTTMPGAAAPADEASAVLRMHDVEVRYQDAVAVQGISLKVQRGQVVVILGPNGAGKTTTLRAITGFVPGDRARVTNGEVLFEGRSTVGLPPHEIAQRGVAVVAERNKVFPALSVWQNLTVVGGRGMPRKDDLDRVCTLFPFIAGRRTQAAGSLSGGERQMLALARALLLRPRLLLIDELSFGLAPVIVERLIDQLRELSAGDLALLLVEQSAEVARALADHVYVLNAGRMVKDGPAEEMLPGGKAAEAYFGVIDEAGT